MAKLADIQESSWEMGSKAQGLERFRVGAGFTEGSQDARALLKC